MYGPRAVRGQFIVWTMLLVLVLGAAVALAQQSDPAGRVTVVMGLVEAEAPDGSVRELQRGDSVYEGEIIRSDDRGRAQIRFTDRGLLSIAPDTELTLDRYAFDEAQPSASEQDIGLERGVLRKQTGQIAAANREGYRVQTPVSVIGVRGTTYAVGIDPDSNATLVGALSGTLEVTSFSGESGVIGAGQAYSYLRVNADGSIDFLLEPPALLDRSPELDEQAPEDAEADLGGGETASPVTGAGGLETTAGIDRQLALLGIRISTDPELAGDLSPSRRGSGEQPTVRPIVEPALSDVERDLLLSDDRLGQAVGVPTLVEDEDGNLSIGGAGLASGIATRNAPILALERTPAAAGTPRDEVLAGADVLLAGNSSGLIADEEVDFAGVEGLVWGRFESPITLFLDPEDADSTLAIDNDILFALGTPSDLAELEGVHGYELAEYRTLQQGGGLAIMGVDGQGILDMGSGAYEGSLGIDYGGEGLSHRLSSTFSSQVSQGVLEAFEVVAEFIDLGTETATEAEGELSGFFTGLEAAFLQMAFDFRVPERDDADVSGLALFERLAEEVQPEPVLSDRERDLLAERGRLALAAGTAVPVEDGDPERRLTGGLGALDKPGALIALDPDTPGLNAALAGSERPELVGELDLLLLEADNEVVQWERGVGGIDGLDWARFEAPVSLFTDPEDRDQTLTLERDLLVALGTPTDISDLVGIYNYQLASHEVVSSGLPVLGVEAFGELNMRDASFMGALAVALGDEGEGGDSFGIAAQFSAAVAAGVLDEVNMQELLFLDLNDESASAAEGEVGGFFTGQFGRALQLGFDIRVPSREDADVHGLALLEQSAEAFNLSADELAALEDPVAFAAAGCCQLGQAGGIPHTFAGRATDPDQMDMDDMILAFEAGKDPSLFVRNDGAALVPADAELPEGFSAWTWQAGDGAARVYSREAGDVLRAFNEDLLVVTGPRPSLAGLEGVARFELETLLDSSARIQTPDMVVDGRVESADLGFNVDFADGSIWHGRLDMLLGSAEAGNGDRPGLDDLDGVSPGGDGEIGEGDLIIASAMAELVAFFGGQVSIADGEAVVDLAFSEGDVLFGKGERTGLRLDASSISGAFSGEFGERFLSAFYLETEDDETTVFSVAASALLERRELAPFLPMETLPEDVEARLTGAQQESLDRVGLATFGSVSFDEEIQGVLLGRATTANRDELTLAGDFVGAGGDYWGQPAPFVLREGGLRDQDVITLADPTDVRPSEDAPSFEGFEVSWGAWNYAGSGEPRGRLLGNPEDADDFGEINTDVLFASVTPTPLADLPSSGQFLFDGPTAVTGIVGGNLSGFEELGLEFMIDFDTGAIHSGSLVLPMQQGNWEASFDGQLKGAVTEFRLNDLILRSEGNAFGDLEASSMSGVLTGPDGTRHAGAFHFVPEEGSWPDEVQGLWVIDGAEID